MKNKCKTVQNQTMGRIRYFFGIKLLMLNFGSFGKKQGLKKFTFNIGRGTYDPGMQYHTQLWWVLQLAMLFPLLLSGAQVLTTVKHVLWAPSEQLARVCTEITPPQQRQIYTIAGCVLTTLGKLCGKNSPCTDVNSLANLFLLLKY